MAISSTDLALLSARLGVARLGASRLGFIPYDVEGALSDEAGEYVWHEIVPPESNVWTLVCDSWICVQSQKVAFEEEEPATGTIVGGTGAYHDHWIFRLYKDGVLYDTQHLASDQLSYTWLNAPEGDYYLTVSPSENPEVASYTSTTETLAADQTINLSAYGGGG
jgi:hypothetical protein